MPTVPAGAATPRPPSPAQLHLLRNLALESGQTFAIPATAEEASEQITRLKTAATQGYWKPRRTSRAGTSRTRAARAR